MTPRYAELHQLSVTFANAFNQHDLDQTMSFFTPDAVYDELNGRKHEGLVAIRKAFEPLFSRKFGTMRFDEDDTFIDAEAGKVMASWRLQLAFDGKPVVLQGLDLLYFAGDKIVRKLTYCKAKTALYEEQ